MKDRKSNVPTISLIEGDGIGPEITQAALKVIEASGAKVQWEKVSAGSLAIEEFGTPMPQSTLDSIEKNGLALKGPLCTPVGSGFGSVNVALRKHFDLYANLRPAKTVEGIPAPCSGVDMVIVRENIEDLYSGIESYTDATETRAEAVSVITEKGSERIVRFAFRVCKKTRPQARHSSAQSKHLETHRWPIS